MASDIGLLLGLVAWGVDDSSAPEERERALLRGSRCPLSGKPQSAEERASAVVPFP